MSPKITLALLICSCVVLGLANADHRPKQRKTQSHLQSPPKRRMAPEGGQCLAGPPGPPGPPGPTGLSPGEESDPSADYEEQPLRRRAIKKRH